MLVVLHSDINFPKSGLLNLPASLFKKRVDQQKSKIELETYFLVTISLIDTTNTLAY
jgi:hypothetical protein